MNNIQFRAGKLVERFAIKTAIGKKRRAQFKGCALGPDIIEFMFQCCDFIEGRPIGNKPIRAVKSMKPEISKECEGEKR